MAQPSTPQKSASPAGASSGVPGGSANVQQPGGGGASDTSGNGAVAVPAPPFQISAIHESQHWLKIFIYGTYGVGKTRLAGSAALVPQMRDILMIDAEAGGLTIATDNEIAEDEARGSIDRVRVSTFTEFAKIQEFLKLHCKYRDEDDEASLKKMEARLRGDYDADRPARRYNTVIIDSLSEVDAFSMYQLLGITDRTKLDEEVASAEWAEYKKNHTQILRAVRAYRDLPMNVIITAASEYTQDDKKRFIHKPNLTGKLARHVQGFMDVVGFYAMQNVEGEEVRRLYVQPGAQYDAKNRFSSYREKYFEDPTIESILRAVRLLKK